MFLEALIIIILTAIYIALTLKIPYEPKIIEIIFTKFFLIFLHLDGTLKIAFLNQKAVNLRFLSYFSEKRRC